MASVANIEPVDSMAQGAGVAARARATLPGTAWLVIGAYGAVVLFFALAIAFPTKLDELEHFSVIRAQFEHPALFPDWSRYVLLRGDDPTQWTATPNYINHPSLYYLLFAPLLAITSDPMAFRLFNALLSIGALVIVVIAAHRRVAADMVPPPLFAILAASFPKAAVVGGIVNNDNLAALAAAALFAGMTGGPGAGIWIIAALAVAGWTKLTAFLALGTVAAVWLGLRMAARSADVDFRLLACAALGALIGAIPYAHTFLHTGHILWVNETMWRVPLAERAHLDLADFARQFFRAFLYKWPAAEWAYPLQILLPGLAVPIALAALAMRGTATGNGSGRNATMTGDAIRHIAIAYVAALIVLFAVHFIFAWRNFQAIGDLTTTQTRYYNVLWPGIAFAAAATTRRFGRYFPYAGWTVAAICLSPTIVGMFVYAAL